MSTRGETRAVVERYIASLNTHDPDAVAACVTRGFHNEHTSAIGHSLRGRDTYRERLPQFLSRFTELHYEVEDWIVDGDRAAIPYTMTCRYVTDEGPPHPVTIRGIFRLEVSDGGISHRVDYWDSAEFVRQTEGSQ